MAKSHPAQFDDHGAPHLAQWARNTVASFTLLACLVSLSIILHTQYGLRLAGAIVHGLGAIDLTQLVNLADTPANPVALASCQAMRAATVPMPEARLRRPIRRRATRRGSVV